MIAGAGVALDTVRVDFAAGAIEQLVIESGADQDLVIIEGAIALNTALLDLDTANDAIAYTQAATGLPCTDAVRFGDEILLEAIL